MITIGEVKYERAEVLEWEGLRANTREEMSDYGRDNYVKLETWVKDFSNLEKEF